MSQVFKQETLDNVKSVESELKDINILVKVALVTGIVLTVKALEIIYKEDSEQCKIPKLELN